MLPFGMNFPVCVSLGLLAYMNFMNRDTNGEKNYFDQLFLIQFKENIPHYYAGLYANEKAQLKFCKNWACKESYFDEKEKKNILHTMNLMKNYMASGEHSYLPGGVDNMHALVWSEQLAIFSQFIANVCPEPSESHMFEMYIHQLNQYSFCEYSIASISLKGVSTKTIKSMIYRHIYENGLHDIIHVREGVIFPLRCTAYLVGCGYNIRTNDTYATDCLVCTYCGNLLEECQQASLSDRCEYTNKQFPFLCEYEIPNADIWKNATAEIVSKAKKPLSC